MSERLEILITAKDEATKVLTGLGNASKGAFSTAMKVGAAGGVALAAGIGASIVAAMDAEVTLAKLNSVIESTGGVAGVTVGEAQALADELARVTRYSDDQIESAETLLLTFTNIGEDIFPLTTETVLNMGEAFGNTDAAAIQLGKALNDPITGVGALAEVGVSFTEAQKDMITEMVEAGDIAGAQAIILEELGREFGGMARAAGDTAAGKLAIFKNQLIDVAQAIGAAFLPFLSRGFDRLIEFVAPMSETITKLGQLVNIVGEFGTASTMVRLWAVGLFGSDVGHRIADVIAKFGEIRDVLLGFLTDTIIPFVQDHLPAFKAALLAVGVVIGGAVVLGGILTLIGTLGALLSGIGPIIAAVALLAAAWTEDWLGIRTAVTGAWYDHIKPALDAALGFLTNTFGDELSQIWDGIKEGDIEAIKAGIQGIIDEIVLLVETWGPVVTTALVAFSDAFWEWIPGALETALTELGFFLWEVGAWIVDVAAPVLIEQLLKWGTAFVSWIPGALLDLILWLGGLLLGMHTWITDTAAPKIIEKIADWAAAFVDWVGPALVDLVTALGGLLLGIGTWIVDTAVPQLVTDALSMGGAIVTGLEQGISAGWDAFKDWFLGLLGGLVDDALGFFGIASPSKMFMGMGQNIVEGMRIGLEGMKPVLEGGILAPMAAAAGGAQAISASTTNNYTQIVNTNARASDVINDFKMMQAWAGV